MPSKKSSKGFEDLLEVHTKALENNSKSVIEILEVLSKRNLQIKDREALKRINKEIKALDRRVDSLDDIQCKEESWWD